MKTVTITVNCFSGSSLFSMILILWLFLFDTLLTHFLDDMNENKQTQPVIPLSCMLLLMPLESKETLPLIKKHLKLQSRYPFIWSQVTMNLKTTPGPFMPILSFMELEDHVIKLSWARLSENSQINMDPLLFMPPKLHHHHHHQHQKTFLSLIIKYFMIQTWSFRDRKRFGADQFSWRTQIWK